MTPTEKAKRAEALYYDNNNITRRTLCHMIVNLEADMKDAVARNVQLREQITTQKQTIQAYRDESREWREVAERAQAVNTTLGRGTCHNTEEYPFMWSFTCSECGVHSITEGRGFNFCPNCGRKVVDE